MLTVEQIKNWLEGRSLRRIARLAGIHPATMYRFMQDDSSPLYETVKALSDYITSRQSAEVVHG